MSELQKELEALLNKCSAEKGSDTTAFILAQYLISCLDAFDRAVTERQEWYEPSGQEDKG